jgi:hypothetical protein
MIGRDGLVARLCRMLEHDYVALLGQRGAAIEDVVGELRSDGKRRGLRLLSLPLPADVSPPDEFQELVLERLRDGAAQLPGGGALAERVVALLREHERRTLGYRIRTVLNVLGAHGQGTQGGLLVIVVQALPDVAEDRLRELLMVIRGFHDQRGVAGEPGERLRFLAVGGGALWRLCYHRQRNRSPFNIARRVLVGGLDGDELARRFPGRSADWLCALRAASDGVPALVQAIDEAGGELADAGRYFGAIQDHWNALGAESRALLVAHTGRDDLGDCVPDYACPGVAELEPPHMEAFWHGFLRADERRLVWRSEIHRAFVIARAPKSRPRRAVGSTPPASAPPPMKIFVSYARRDRQWLTDFKTQLAPAERDGLVSTWIDVENLPGTRWLPRIRVAIDEARIAILLVSPSFLASKFIATEEVPRILGRANERGLVVMPVILTVSNFADMELLSRFGAFNSPEEPLDAMRRPKRMKVLRDLAARVLALRDRPTWHK